MNIITKKQYQMKRVDLAMEIADVIKKFIKSDDYELLLFFEDNPKWDYQKLMLRNEGNKVYFADVSHAMGDVFYTETAI